MSMRMNWRRHAVAAVLLVGIMIMGGAAVSAQDRDFVQVTDAMLENPDPADWLNWRRTLDGWGYSPLDQINTDNVHQLQLVWSWQLGRGRSQLTPLVHDGVMYIPNPGNIVQALDATTGDRLWQYTPEPEDPPDEGPDAAPGRGSRSIAIYGDKIYLKTTDAHIVALDAGTGEVVWDHTVADRALGYRYTSGPIVARGNNRGRYDRVPELQERRLLHLRTRCRDRGRTVAHVDRRPTGRAGWRHLGRPAADVSRGRRLVDPR